MNSVAKPDALPIEILLHIFSYANGKTLICASQTCSYWRKAIDGDKFLWKRALQEDYAPFFDQPPYASFYKQAYGEHCLKEKKWRIFYGCYYAAGFWNDLSNGKIAASIDSLRRQYIFSLVKNKLRLPEICGKKEKIKGPVSHLTFFQFYENFWKGNEDEKSLRTLERYWVQARIPRHLRPRLCHITELSGKIFTFVEEESAERLWEKFKRAYEQGKLGYALRGSTAKANPSSRDHTVRVFTVHLLNCFDLEETGKIAWEINQLLGKWVGALQCATDISLYKKIKEKSYCGRSSLASKTLYTIKSSHFISKNDCVKSQKLFVKHFMINNSQRAAEVLKILEPKALHKGYIKLHRPARRGVFNVPENHSDDSLPLARQSARRR